MFEVTINQSREFIEAAVKSQLEATEIGKSVSYMYLGGSPGIGKSQFAEEVCRKNGWGFAPFYMSNMLLEMITGLPKVTENNSEFCEWTRPALFDFRNLRLLPKEKDGTIVMLLDDAHLADVTMQRYLFSLLTYRRINGHTLPDNVAIVLAGNGEADKAGAEPILAPIANRMFFLSAKADAKDWVNNFALKYGVKEEIVSFIMTNSNALFSEPLESAPWASPRSWTYLSDFLKAMKPQDTEQLISAVQGHIGEEHAKAFVEYVECFYKWEAEDILLGNKEAPSKKISTMDTYTFVGAASAALNGLIEASEGKKTQNLIKAFKKYKEIMLDGFLKTKSKKVVVVCGLKMVVQKMHNSRVHRDIEALFDEALMESDETREILMDFLEE